VIPSVLVAAVTRKLSSRVIILKPIFVQNIAIHGEFGLNDKRDFAASRAAESDLQMRVGV
jgi:hypothetical protein